MIEKLRGLSCPICDLPKCFHRCDNCEAKFYWKHPITHAPCRRNPKTGRNIPYDSLGNLHNMCMRNGVKEPRVPEQHDMMHDLHEYLRHELRLGNDNYWHKFHDGRYAGRHSKATSEELTSWDPNKK